MDNQRVFLIAAIAFVGMLIWQAWLEDYGQTPASTPATTASTPATSKQTPQDLPTAPPAPGTTESTPGVPATPTAAAQGKQVRIVSDVLDLAVNTLGADIVRAALLTYPVAVDKPREPFLLLDDRRSEPFVTQTGLLAQGPAPNHHTPYVSGQTEYRLAEGADQVEARFTWHDPSGIEVNKIYTLKRGSYVVGLRYEVKNAGAQPWEGHYYRQLAHGTPEKQSAFIAYSYNGGVIYSPEEKYEKLPFDDMAEQPLKRDIKDGWAAIIQHYFLAAWVPPAHQANQYYSKALDDGRYVLGLTSPAARAAPGASASFESRLYLGPKLQDHLAEVAPGLELTVDYGVLTIIAQPIFWLLRQIHRLVGNWGVAIILLTLLIKLAFYKLSEASYKSMANMRRLQPRLQALKERYGDDRAKLNQAMMEMYKKEKINPLGGCLPIVVQIPVFIALYWVLLESVEMRQAPFMLWIKDLSSADPYYVLPLLMGATMFIQQKLNPAPLDPIQAKVMMAMPVLFTVFFVFFPAGLVLYWVVNNGLSILQQWVITKRVEGAAKAA
jgi:YidC/Oxa1 family membrane protein insertase